MPIHLPPNKSTENQTVAGAGLLQSPNPNEVCLVQTMEGEEESSAGGMIDEIYSNGGDAKRNRPIISGEALDIEAYASLYSGRTKITRLLFIADRCENRQMQMEAYRMAYDEIKKGENTQLYREVVQKIDGRLGPQYGLDVAWTEAVERRAEQRKEKLENELNAYRVWFLIGLLFGFFFECVWLRRIFFRK